MSGLKENGSLAFEEKGSWGEMLAAGFEAEVVEEATRLMSAAVLRRGDEMFAWAASLYLAGRKLGRPRPKRLMVAQLMPCDMGDLTYWEREKVRRGRSLSAVVAARLHFWIRRLNRLNAPEGRLCYSVGTTRQRALPGDNPTPLGSRRNPIVRHRLDTRRKLSQFSVSNVIFDNANILLFSRPPLRLAFSFPRGRLPLPRNYRCLVGSGGPKPAAGVRLGEAGKTSLKIDRFPSRLRRFLRFKLLGRRLGR